MSAATTPFVPAGLAAILRGERVSWRDLALPQERLLELCDREELRGLMFSRIAGGEATRGWPPDLQADLAQHAREETAREMLRREEIAGVLSALHNAAVRPIVFKGTALAYTVYDTPIARPRLDTDLLIDPVDRHAAQRALEACGYAAAPFCDELFSQFQMERTDAFGLRHVVDLHWKISTQPVFADVLTWDEMWPHAIPVPALGPAAVAPSGVHALLLACIHPVMHHQNAERILWTYDTHLLASVLTRPDFADFVRTATRRSVAAVCRQALGRAQAVFATRVPGNVMRELAAAVDEPSAEYLGSHRRWHHELASSVRGLPRVSDRMRLLREVLLPSAGYMLGKYRLRGTALGPWLLPALYVHRNILGAWKILTGKK